MRASFLFLAAVFLSGCATSLFSTTDQPEALDPVPIAASAEFAYEEALALGFDRGYHIAYAAEEERLLEMERLDRRLFQEPRVRRLDLLVRERDGQTFLHARYHSFPQDNPSAIAVQDEDRKAAEAFVSALREQLRARAAHQ